MQDVAPIISSLSQQQAANTTLGIGVGGGTSSIVDNNNKRNGGGINYNDSVLTSSINTVPY